MANLSMSDDVRADLATMHAIMDATPAFLRGQLVNRGAPEGIVDENFLRLLANRDPSKPFHAIRAGDPAGPFDLGTCTDGEASPIHIHVDKTGAMHLQCGHASPHRWQLDGQPL
jgi:hypothetical protein